MAKGFKHGAGGGAGLNFKVVGNPQPENPKENTLWVNTDQKITSWIFSATEPEAPEEGMVLIAIGTSSSVTFNALKKNGIQVYPISAKQYISGVWKNVTAQSYVGGEWVQFSSSWNGELYEIGNQHADKTGGWSGSGWTDYNDVYTVQSITVGSSGIIVKTTSDSGNVACVCGTKNKVSFSGYKTIDVTVSSFSNSFWVGICPNKQFWDDEGETPMLALKRITAKGTTKLSIPSGVSSAYIVIYGFSTDEKLSFGTVSKVKMTK